MGTNNIYLEVITEFGIQPLMKSATAVYTINSDTMDRALLAQVQNSASMYLHAFGVSKNFVVLPMNLQLNVPIDGKLLDAMVPHWDGVKVVSLNGQVQVFQTEPFFHVHIANT